MKPPRLLLFALSGLACVGLAACGVTDPQTNSPEIMPVQLATDAAHDTLMAPDTVDAGVPFIVVFNTLEGGCKIGTRVNVVVSGAVAEVSGVDVFSGRLVCPQNVVITPQAATVTLWQRGADTIRVVGRLGPAEDRRGAELSCSPGTACGDVSPMTAYALTEIHKTVFVR